MDWKAMGFDLTGSESTGLDFTALDAMIIPCASKVTL